jgi:hypothetical protein
MTNQETVIKNNIELLCRKDVAQILKIGISSVDKIPECELPKVHLGKSIRYKQKNLIDYIDSKVSKYDK